METKSIVAAALAGVLANRPISPVNQSPALDTGSLTAPELNRESVWRDQANLVSTSDAQSAPTSQAENTSSRAEDLWNTKAFWDPQMQKQALADVKLVEDKFEKTLQALREAFAGECVINFLKDAQETLDYPPTRTQSSGRVIGLRTERVPDYLSAVQLIQHDTYDVTKFQPFYPWPSQKLSDLCSGDLPRSLEKARQAALQLVQGESPENVAMRAILREPIYSQEVKEFITGVGGARLILFLDERSQGQLIKLASSEAEIYEISIPDWRSKIKEACDSVKRVRDTHTSHSFVLDRVTDAAQEVHRRGLAKTEDWTPISVIPAKQIDESLASSTTPKVSGFAAISKLYGPLVERPTD